MRRLIIIAVVALFIPPSLFAQEKQTYQGKKNKESLVDAYVVGFSYGPRMPEKEFKQLSLPKNDQFDSAQYRATVARYEMFTALHIDLIALFEDLGRTVISSYNVPLDEAVDFDNGRIDFVEWKRFDTLVIQCTEKRAFQVTIKILSNGKFQVSKME